MKVAQVHNGQPQPCILTPLLPNSISKPSGALSVSGKVRIRVCIPQFVLLSSSMQDLTSTDLFWLIEGSGNFPVSTSPYCPAAYKLLF